MKRDKRKKSLLPYLFLALFIIAVLYLIDSAGGKVNEY